MASRNPEGHNPRWWKQHPEAKAKAEQKTIIQPATPNPTLWKTLWKWQIVGTVAALFVGGGVSLMQWQPILADVLFSIGFILLIARLLIPSEHANSQGISVGLILLLVLVVAVGGNHKLHNLYPFNSTAEAGPVIPVVTWLNPAPIIYGTALSTMQLNARSSVDGEFVCTPGIGTILPVGTVTLSAMFNPRDSKNYKSTTADVRLVVDPAPSSAAIHQVPFEPELKELEDVSEFIARKDEIELRETFDFPKMLTYNIALARRSVFPRAASPQEAVDIDQFFKNGQSRVDRKYSKVREVNDMLYVEFIPGKIGSLNTSAKYVQSVSRLQHYITSPNLPSPVIDALKEFEITVGKNTDAMVDSLNESLSMDPNLILYFEDTRSPFFGKAENHYWGKFISLRPKAEILNARVRSALGVK